MYAYLLHMFCFDFLSFASKTTRQTETTFKLLIPDNVLAIVKDVTEDGQSLLHCLFIFHQCLLLQLQTKKKTKTKRDVKTTKEVFFPTLRQDSAH